jgi:serine protease Do
MPMGLGRGTHIGVSIRDVDQNDVKRDKLAAERGVVVSDVASESPAEKAGLKAGDVIVEFDGERIRSARHFARLVEETPVGRSVQAAVMRGGTRIDVSVTPQARGGDLSRLEGRIRRRLPDLNLNLPDMREWSEAPFGRDVRPRAGRLGVSVQDLEPQLAEHFGVADGVLVTQVQAGTPAAAAGLKAGDVITSVGGSPVGSAAELRQQLLSAGDDEIEVKIVRDRKESTVRVKVQAPPRPTTPV